MLVIGNPLTFRLVALIGFLLIAACDTHIKPAASDAPTWEGEAPGLYGHDNAPEFIVGQPVEVEEKAEDGSLTQRGYKVRLENARVVRTGEWTYLRDGIVRARGPFDNDTKSGEWTQFYESGHTECIGSYVAGKKTGAWTYYLDLEDSPIKQVELFGKQGALQHRTTFYKEPLNVPKVEANLLDGREVGVIVRYDTNGDCWIIEDRDRNGELTGWEMYLPDGTVFARFANNEYQLQGFTRRLAQPNAFRDAKGRLAKFGGKTRILE